MSKTGNTECDTLSVTPAMRRFVDYFGALGPRWGIRGETTRAHALLYLVGRPVGRDELAAGLEISRAKAASALRDLQEWGMGGEDEHGGWRAGGEPWDLLFRALEARRRREIGPALETLRDCSMEARSDRATPYTVRRRMDAVLRLVENLAAIDRQTQRVPASLFAKLVSISGATSRLLARLAPHNRRNET